MIKDAGPGRVNQLGGLYINGKPLPKQVREEIIGLARLGVRPCDISRRMKITHGCISKLLSKFQKTGSISPGGANVGRPKVITPRIEQKIEQYRREQPGIFSWELRDRLLQENVCRRENLPSLSSISRLIKQKVMNESQRKETRGEEEQGGQRNTLQKLPFNSVLNKQLKEDMKTMEQQENPQTAQLKSTNNENTTSGRTYLLMRPQRRQRARYTSRQLQELEAEFDKNPYPNAWDREALANKLGIHETRIQVWFSNRRAKGRRNPFPDEHTSIQPTSRIICTCHRYSGPDLSQWMLDAGSSRLYFPSGCWDHDSPFTV